MSGRLQRKEADIGGEEIEKKMHRLKKKTKIFD